MHLEIFLRDLRVFRGPLSVPWLQINYFKKVITNYLPDYVLGDNAVKQNEDDITSEEEVAELLDDIEIEAELHQEELVRKKNTKIWIISIIGLAVIAGVYLGTNSYNIISEKEKSADKTARLSEEFLPSQAEMIKTEETDLNKADDNMSEIGLNPPPAKPGTTLKKSIEENKIKLPVTANKKSTKKKSFTKEQPYRNTMPEKNTLTANISISGKYYVQIGVFAVKENAERLILSLKNKHFSPSKSTAKKKIKMYRVFRGIFSDRKKAEKEIANLKKSGINATLKKTASGDKYSVYAGSFSIKQNAERFKNKINTLGFTSKVIKLPVMMDTHKVFVGYFKTKQEAVLTQNKLTKEGFAKTIIVKKS